MRLKLYRAATTRAAMSKIRAELGDEALILSTRKVPEGIEITAAIEPNAETALPRRDSATQSCLAFHGVPTPLAGRLAQGLLPDALAASLQFGALDFRDSARPVMFAGPPGAGKTLTVARLATRLVMEGTMPLVITADGRRAGAAEQLAAFTRLLGLDLLVASQPVALARALARRAPGQPVLIDLPGSSPFDSTPIAEISALAATANGCLALVIPAGLDILEAADLAAGFCTLGAEYLIATRLDLTRRLGGVLAAAQSGLVLAEAGIGPGAADGLVKMSPHFLAERLMMTAAHKGDRQ